MPELKGPVFDFLRLFNKLARSLKLYSKTHPSVIKDSELIMAALNGALKGKDSLALGNDQGILVVQGDMIKDKSEVVAKFIEALKTTRIAQFVIRRGATSVEVLDLIRLTAMKPEEVMKNNRLDPELLRNFRNIKVVEARYVLVTDSEEVVDRTLVGGGEGGANDSTLEKEAAKLLKDAGITKKEDLSQLLDQMFERQIGGAADGGGPVAGGLDGVIDFFNRMSPHLSGMEQGAAQEKMGHYFSTLLSKVLNPEAGMDQALADLEKALDGMPGQCKEILFGTDMQNPDRSELLKVLKRLNPALQGGLVKAEVLSGKLPTDQLKQTIEALAPTPDEFVGLMDMVTTELVKAGGSLDEAQEQMKKLFRLLPVIEETMSVQGSILIMDADENSVAGYTKDLWDCGYLVTPHDSGKRGMDAWHDKKRFDCVIMDIRLPGMSGLEVLNQFMTEENPPPVIVTTENPRFRDAFEVVSYPKLRFFLKPVEASDILAAVMDFCPPKEESDHEDVKIDEREMSRAKDVQMCLVPKELPPIPEFDLAVQYKAAQDVSGDYYDVLALPGGKIGLIVADVSGKNISGAMVMVMVRTVFHSVAANSLSPKSTLIEVNKFLVKDIRRGMFVSAIYGVLDPANRALVIASAGHNPPLVWNRTAGFGEMLELPGMAMGVADNWRFEDAIKEETVLFEAGDRIVLYTDGVTEAMSAKDEEFSEKRFLKLVNFHRGADSATLLKEVMKAIEVHRGLAPQSDDITLLTARLVPGLGLGADSAVKASVTIERGPAAAAATAGGAPEEVAAEVPGGDAEDAPAAASAEAEGAAAGAEEEIVPAEVVEDEVEPVSDDIEALDYQSSMATPEDMAALGRAAEDAVAATAGKTPEPAAPSPANARAGAAAP
ncbi:MAG: fused response regulator/phosphatase, partial [Planctomycetes bacterium]|nr:fused response regulator/phosphatase [Planctomycetota bacterium]